jgi:HPt (histidine-containing phosphotransfer) domain-containing protein
MSAEPVLDGTRLDAICAGDPELAVELVEALIEDAGPMVAGAMDLAARREGHELRETAHALKGVAGNLAAARLRAAAAALEAAAAPETGRDWSQIEQAIGAVAAALEEVRALYARWTDPAGGEPNVFDLVPGV